MIGNISRLGNFLECRRRSYFSDILKLRPFTDSYNLIFGGAIHKGAETLFKTGSAEQALAEAERKLKERYEKMSSFLLPEEIPLIEKYARQSRSATQAFYNFFAQFSDFKVVRPEVRFCVELPNSTHHCRFAHELLYPDFPFELCEQSDMECHIPHFLAGRTDGIALWNKMLWFLEIKTTGDNKESFFRKFILDLQTTAYTYGIRKEAGIDVHGFVLVKIEKPRKNARDPFHYKVEAEPITKTSEDLARFEVEVVQIMNDYESSLPQGEVKSDLDLAKRYKNPASCFNYNEECMFHTLCKGNRLPETGEFKLGEEDYIDLYLKYKVGLLSKEQFDLAESNWREEFR